MRRAAAAALAAGVVTAAPLDAQVVQGRVVVVGTGKPIADVVMRLVRVTPADTASGLPADTAAVATGRTARDGVFSLLAPDTGSYRTRVGDGYLGPVIHLASADSLDAREYRVPLGAARALYEGEVEKQAGLAGGLNLRYPSELQAQCVEGRVTARFVVDTTGRFEPSTFRVLESSHFRFTQALREAVASAQFYPAEVGHWRVRQLVQLPATFTLDGGPCAPPVGPVPSTGRRGSPAVPVSPPSDGSRR